MADKKNLPIETEIEAKEPVEVSLEDRLNEAAERMQRVNREAQQKKEEQARLLKEAEADALRRKEEARAARLAAEKQAKNVAERKLAEYSYAENYRKKLLKDKENNISAAKARELQKKADAEAKRRAEVEAQIAEMLENERREAEERRARQDAALERARAAKEAMPEEAAPIEEIAPIAEAAPAVEEEVASASIKEALEAPVSDDGRIELDIALGADGKLTASKKAPLDVKEDGMKISFPEIKISPVNKAGEPISAPAKKDAPKAPDFGKVNYPEFTAPKAATAEKTSPEMPATPMKALAEDDRYAKYFGELGALSAMVASHDSQLRRIAEGKLVFESSEEPVEETPALTEEPVETVEAEQISTVETEEPVYDEAAIRQDIEKMNRRALPAYLEKSDKKLRKLEKQARRAEKKIDRNVDDEKIEPTLEAIAVRKEIVDLLCENLKCCALFKVTKHNSYFKKKIKAASSKYNALVGTYESLTGEELTKADPAVVDSIIAGDAYSPLPHVTYVKETVQVPVEDTELSADGTTLKVAKKITASENKLRKKLASYVEKKNACATPSQKAALLAECIMIERDIVELHAQSLKDAATGGNAKQIEARKKKLGVAVAEYNEFVTEYENVSGATLVRASETLADDIAAGNEYTPLPEISYNKEKTAPEKSKKEYAKEKKEAVRAAKRGEVMPDDIKYLGNYITKNDKKAVELYKLVKKNAKARRKLEGEELNRAILTGAMLRGKIVELDRDSLIAAYRLDAVKRIPACKEKLLVSVQHYNADITEYNDVTGIKLLKISPTIGEDIVSGRNYQTVPSLRWRERFVEIADLTKLVASDGRVFVFPTLAEIAKEQSLEEEKFLRDAKLGDIPLVSDRPVALPVNTAKLFAKVKVDSKKRIRKFESKLKKAEYVIEKELLNVDKQLEAVKSDDGKLKLTAKKVVLLREIVVRRIEGLTYAVKFGHKKLKETFKLKVLESMVRYNTAIEEYNAVAEEKLSPADAHIPYMILSERDYAPMPEIAYRKEFIEQNGDAVRIVSTLGKNDEKSKLTESERQNFIVAPIPTEYPVAEVGDNGDVASEISLDAWNDAALAQYNAELAENAAIDAKNRADMAEYMKRLSESYSVSADNNRQSANYYRDLTNESAIKSDNSAKMAVYYAKLAEEQRQRAEYIAAEAAAYERDALASAERIKAYAEKTRETVDIAGITMLDAYDGLERKLGVGIVTSASQSYRASVAQILDDKGLRKYAEKSDKLDRAKEGEMRALVRRADKAVGNEKITNLLDAIVAAKARFDIIVDVLKQAVRSDSPTYKKLYAAKLRGAIDDYNALTDSYAAISLKPLSKIDRGIVDLVLDGKRFTPVPDITYTRGFKAPGEENVVILKPGVSVEEAVSTTNFTNRAALVETINKQLGIDIDSVSKGVEYEIKMLERSENVSQAYRFGLDGKKELKAAKEKIRQLKKDGIKAIELEKRDNERYYSVVYANPMTVNIVKADKGKKKKSRLELEHDKKTVMASRDEVARIRENVIALLDERHKLNCELVALYTGADVDPHGLPVSDKYQDKRMRAARRSYRKLKGKAALVKQLSRVSDSTKKHIYDLMNKKIVMESNLALFKYRYRNEKHTRIGKKLILKDIRSTMKSIRIIDRDIKGFLGRAVRVHRDKRSPVWGYTTSVIILIFIASAAVLCYLFREPLMAWLGSIFS